MEKVYPMVFRREFHASNCRNSRCLVGSGGRILHEGDGKASTEVMNVPPQFPANLLEVLLPVDRP